LPCIVHDYINAREVLGEYGDYINMQVEGELAQTLLTFKQKFDQEKLIKAAYQMYSWDILKEEYLDMITKIAD